VGKKNQNQFNITENKTTNEVGISGEVWVWRRFFEIIEKKNEKTKNKKKREKKTRI
jgi:hypothetical protein